MKEVFLESRDLKPNSFNFFSFNKYNLKVLYFDVSTVFWISTAEKLHIEQLLLNKNYY